MFEFLYELLKKNHGGRSQTSTYQLVYAHESMDSINKNRRTKTNNNNLYITRWLDPVTSPATLSSQS